MSVDIVCADLAFLDMTFVGLDAVPGPGEERHADALVRSPGGAAITAIGCARLGLRTALASPLGGDQAGEFLRRELAAEGVEWTGRTIGQTAVTAVLPAGGERAMATVAPDEHSTAAEIAASEPAAVVLGLSRCELAPPGADVYATVGDAEARAGNMPDRLDGMRALVLNAREARLLTGREDPAEAARVLADRGATAVVTRGGNGAVACVDGDVASVPGHPAPAVDTTGAGDLFTAAYVWADLAGAALDERLRWAVLYAGLGVGVPTAVAGAPTLKELARAGEDQGLAPPAVLTSAPMRRDR